MAIPYELHKKDKRADYWAKPKPPQQPNPDEYLKKLNELVWLCAKQGYQLHRYYTTADTAAERPRIVARYALHPLGLPRPAQYRGCEGGLLYHVRGREGVTWASHAYKTLDGVVGAFMSAYPMRRSPGGVPDYTYARDGQGDPIYRDDTKLAPNTGGVA